MKTRIAFVFAFVLAIVAAGTVDAHNPSATLTCVEGSPSLHIGLSNYNGNVANSVSWGIDGASDSAPLAFSTSYTNLINAGSPFVGHTAQVVILAGDDPTGSHGWTITYNLSVDPCQDATPAPPTPTPTPTATPTPEVTPTPVPTPTVDPCASPTIAPDIILQSACPTTAPSATPSATPIPSTLHTPAPTPPATDTAPPVDGGGLGIGIVLAFILGAVATGIAGALVLQAREDRS
jgi:hypothetical protein